MKTPGLSRNIDYIRYALQHEGIHPDEELLERLARRFITARGNIEQLLSVSQCLTDSRNDEKSSSVSFQISHVSCHRQGQGDSFLPRFFT